LHDFILEGGYGAFGPAMLVYRENTTAIKTRVFNAYFQRFTGMLRDDGRLQRKVKEVMSHVKT